MLDTELDIGVWYEYLGASWLMVRDEQQKVIWQVKQTTIFFVVDCKPRTKLGELEVKIVVDDKAGTIVLGAYVYGSDFRKLKDKNEIGVS
jgi:hypothetical protein